MTRATPPGLHERVRAWLEDEVDTADADELRALLDAGADDELDDRFAATLAFGTAGLRGPLRAGPNGMNRAVVRRAAAGLATWLVDHGQAGQPIVIGYDARHRSADFARDSARIMVAAGFAVRLIDRHTPTPVLAFAVRRLDAAAGIMVTASHNPAADNGYKVYAHDGAQIIPPMDTEIEAAISAVGATRSVVLADSTGEPLGDDLVEDYVRAVAGLAGDGPRELRVVHTAMHGVGDAVARAVLGRAGFADVTPVSEQAEPDPDFPTVAFPNPEEPGALDLALRTARRCDADLVIANDPDADRCAVAVPDGAVDGGWRALRGDEVGVLLADALLRRGVRGTYATTIVSSSMLHALAERAAVGYAETLTGFKWVSRAADDLVFGYEEALGYAVAPELVKDKDGISAALLVAELSAELKAGGSSLPARLEDLAASVGRYRTDQISVRVDDLAQIDALMRRMRDSPPRRLLDSEVTAEDLTPVTDAVRWRFGDPAGPHGRVVIRPSGTEPKLKAYLETVVPAGSAADDDAPARLRDEVAALLAD